MKYVLGSEWRQIDKKRISCIEFFYYCVELSNSPISLVEVWALKQNNIEDKSAPKSHTHSRIVKEYIFYYTV